MMGLSGIRGQKDNIHHQTVDATTGVWVGARGIKMKAGVYLK